MNRVIHFISYGDDEYKRSKLRIAREAQVFGLFKTINIYGPKNFDKDFIEKCGDLLNVRKGGGYWIWKPYVIYQTLRMIKEGEYLVYLDAGCTINPGGRKRFLEYLDMLDNSEKEYGIISLDMGFPEREWTKKEVFDYLGVDLESDMAKSGQYVGGILTIKKNKHSMRCVERWYKTLVDNPELFATETKAEKKYLKEHRHDQSIFSLIRKQERSVVIPDETFFNDWREGIKKGSVFWATRIK